MCFINNKIQNLLQKSSKVASITENTTVSVDEALNKLQQSKEITAESIARVFKTAHEGLNKFKQATLNKLEELNNKVIYKLENESNINVSYSISDNCYKDTMNIIDKCFTIKFISQINNNNCGDSYEPKDKCQKSNKDNGKFYLDDIISVFETDNER